MKSDVQPMVLRAVSEAVDAFAVYVIGERRSCSAMVSYLMNFLDAGHQV